MASYNKIILPNKTIDYFQWTKEDFETLSSFEKFKKKSSDENYFEKSKMDRSQIEREKEILCSDEKWTVPDNFKGISKEDISHIKNENELKITNSNENTPEPHNIEKMASYSGLTESFCEFDSKESFPYHCLYWPDSGFGKIFEILILYGICYEL